MGLRDPLRGPAGRSDGSGVALNEPSCDMLEAWRQRHSRSALPAVFF